MGVKTCTKFSILLAAGAALFALGGCGSDSSSSGGAATSAKAPGDPVSRGIITSVGTNSITVNGVDFDTTGATITTDDPSDTTTLAKGMLVTVTGTFSDAIRGKATAISMANDLKGPISTFNNISSSMTVLGQRVKFDAGKTAFANFSGAVFGNFSGGSTSKLAPGQMVRVSGLVDPTGVVHASFVQRKLPNWTPATPVTIRGTVTSTPTATGFSIGNLTVNLSGTALPAGTAVGSLVRVTGTIATLTGTTLTATGVQSATAGIQGLGVNGDAAVTEGYVSGLSGSTFTVGGTPVNAGNLDVSQIANGSLVLVRGTINNGVVLLTGIEVNNPAYLQTNLVSNIPGVATTTDANLINSWGIARSPSGPWWVNDNGTGVATVYTGLGAPSPTATPLVVTIPVVAGGTTPAPVTGIVFNNFSGFNVTAGDRTTSAKFIMVTENGTIAAWNAGTTATQKVNNFVTGAGAVYKGAALATNAGSNLLYVANFRGATVDVFNSNFARVTLPASPTGAPFSVPAPRVGPPTGYAPFNVTNVGGKLYVSYALLNTDTKLDDVPGQGHGFVEVFNPDGSFVTSLQNGLWFNSPWGVTLAPADFGKFSNKLLVGNFGSGQIAVFEPLDGKFLGLLRDKSDDPIVINGLWGLGFGNGGSAGPSNTLFFAAGLNGESDGLFGTLTPAALSK